MKNELRLKTRFVPSPTGLMHIGNLRTALFSALLANAKNKKGKFLIRIEDSDKVRSKPEFVDALLEDLKWLKLKWQEGPEQEGQHGPYFQSQRVSIYQEYYQFLLDKQLAYPCFCTEQELKLFRKTQMNAGIAPRYPGTCRHLNEEQIQQKKDKGLDFALRFAVPKGQTIRFEDLIQGPKVFNTDDLGDFIIKKTDGSASFMFCNAVDDALMEVTHAFRGEDHLTNTPRQLLILNALNLTAPQYGHMALILGNDGKPLSKRNGSQSVQSLREQGFLPLAILNYLSRLGHRYDNEKWMSLEDLANHFSIQSLSRSPAYFDAKQLTYWQQETIGHMSQESLWEWFSPFLEPNSVPLDKQEVFCHAIQNNLILPEDARHWAKVFFEQLEPLDAKNLDILKQAQVEYFEAAIEALATCGPNHKEMFNAIKEKTNLKGKKLFLPMRVALTGLDYGPEFVKIFEVLDAQKISDRLNQAKQLIQ